MIKSIKDIQDILLDKCCFDWKSEGNVYVKEQGDLILFNYTAKATFDSNWNFFEIISRGLILNKNTGEIVARPFDKFFNWGQDGQFTSSHIKIVAEKIDGSLGILYRDEDKLKVTTRGSFESDQAMWATDYLNLNYNLFGLPNEVTLLFEIIYPKNRIVVDYKGKEDLILLAVRNRFNGEYYSQQAMEELANHFGFNIPKVYDFDTPEKIKTACKYLDGDKEGWVAEFENGQRFKFKGEDYLKLHRLISGLSFKNTLKYVENGKLDKLLEIVPDEFLDTINEWVELISNTVSEMIFDVEEIFKQAPKGSRKEFAIWVNTNHKSLSSYLFTMLDDKPIKPLIYKKAFKQVDDL